MEISKKTSSILIISILLLVASCISKPYTATFQSTINETSTSTRTPRPTLTRKPTVTATLIRPTIPAATLIAKSTLEPLEKLCDEFETDSTRSSEISPYGEWFAISCGYKRNQKLVVQNLEGIKWVINFSDFFDITIDGEGGFEPLAWSSDGRFFYFSKVFGISGGGNQCFPGHGVYGLYRLHLKTGTLVTLIPSNRFFPGNEFPGTEIKFSPTSEYYAVDRHGVTITNLNNDEIIVIDTSGVMEMNWSPDGRFLVFSTATCGEELADFSSMYVWDSVTTQTKVIFSTQGMRLMIKSWISNSSISFEGDAWEAWEDGSNHTSTLFEYDITGDKMIFSGTATPRP